MVSYRLALRERHAGVRVPAIVKADVGTDRLPLCTRCQNLPSVTACTKLSLRREGEDPGGAAGQAVENLARGGREPDRARPDLAIAQEQLAPRGSRAI